MLLAVDVGNTTTEFALFSGRTHTGGFRLMTRGAHTADDLGRHICDYFSRAHLDLAEVEDVIISSVVPDIMPALKRAVAEVWNRRPLVVNEDVRPSLGYLPGANAAQHGADRSVACMAAVEKYGAPLIVADFGTATTVDAVSRDGFCVGGCICPGLMTGMEALAQNAALLPRVELRLPETFLGEDTVTQIQIGVVGQAVGGADYLIRRTRAEMEEPDDVIRVVATGGFSRLVAAHTDIIDIVDEGLILDGLVRIWEAHRKAGEG